MFKMINWRYAIGEIVIVIIGITIAFALNRYTENVKNQATKKKYLKSIAKDLDNEIEHLEENIQKFESKVQNIKNIFPYLYGRQDGRDSIAPKIFALTEIVNYYPHDVTYKILINSGDLSLFKSFELRRALENHYSSHILIEQDYQRQNKIHENYFADFLMYHYDYDKVRKGDYSFIDNKILKSIIQGLYGTYLMAMKTSRAGQERCRELKEILNQQLKKNN